jgi:hypothetical protein
MPAKFDIKVVAAAAAATAVVAIAVDLGLRWWRSRRTSLAVEQSRIAANPKSGTAFERACEAASSLPSRSLSVSDRLELYGLYKQATEGPCAVRISEAAFPAFIPNATS